MTCLPLQSCQADLVKDNGHKYFLSVLADSYMPVSIRQTQSNDSPNEPTWNGRLSFRPSIEPWPSSSWRLSSTTTARGRYGHGRRLWFIYLSGSFLVRLSFPSPVAGKYCLCDSYVTSAISCSVPAISVLTLCHLRCHSGLLPASGVQSQKPFVSDAH